MVGMPEDNERLVEGGCHIPADFKSPAYPYDHDADDWRDYSYLFEARLGRGQFVSIEEEMAQLNNFGVILMDATEQRLRLASEALDTLNAGHLPSGLEEYGEWQGELGDSFELEVSVWEDTLGFVSKATVLLLLHILTEKGLKDLCSYNEEVTGDKLGRKPPSTSKIDHCLTYLQTAWDVPIDEPPEGAGLRSLTARIRNNFAHGDWDKVREAVVPVGLVTAFRTVAALFASLEAACEGTWPDDHFPSRRPANP